MRGLVICAVLILLSVSVNTQRSVRTLDADNKLFIITLDGFRWEELYKGADSSLIHDPEATGDTALAKALYWADDEAGRRKKLMPFFWNVVNRQGQLFGNRTFGNKVNVSNPYALSYPGYSELLTGSVDYSIHSNDKITNHNKNILEALNSSPAYAGKVAAFTSWDVFPYILNKERSGLMINSGLQNISGQLSSAESLINTVQTEVLAEHGATRYDELTYIACKEYLVKKKPSIVFLSFSGTDDAGHSKRYDQYLQEANNADRMIGELWRYVQGDPAYAGKTTFLITTDHGRGASPSNWHKHGLLVSGSSQTWFALMGRSVVPLGEVKAKGQVYQKDLKDLVNELLAQ
ncbi:MAG TPA: alkaline phosphatase family protein [Flavisolibacter sp.]|jgi:hypothetical protein|nr:alkaline phosphatase family protein [Flavisolibacter sp.]